MQKLTYDVLALDAGAKYRGLSFQSEYYFRRLSDFQTDLPSAGARGPSYDNGFQVQADAHGRAAAGRRATSLRPGERRLHAEPWELSGGASSTRSGTRAGG